MIYIYTQALTIKNINLMVISMRKHSIVYIMQYKMTKCICFQHLTIMGNTLSISH